MYSCLKLRIVLPSFSNTLIISDNYEDLPTQAVVGHLAGLAFITFTITVWYVLSNDKFKVIQDAPVELLNSGQSQDHRTIFEK